MQVSNQGTKDKPNVLLSCPYFLLGEWITFTVWNYSLKYSAIIQSFEISHVLTWDDRGQVLKDCGKVKGVYISKKKQERDFPGVPVVKTSCFHCRGAVFHS